MLLFLIHLQIVSDASFAIVWLKKKKKKKTAWEMWHNLVRSFHLGFLPYIYLFYLLSRPSSAYLLLSHVSPTFCLIIIPSSHLDIFVTSWRLPMVTLELRKRVDPVFLKIFKQLNWRRNLSYIFLFTPLCPLLLNQII